MTDLDELRRIAYGRTSSPDEEAAAALARVELATHESERVDEARRVLDAERRVEPVDTVADNALRQAQRSEEPAEPDDALRQAQRPEAPTEPRYLRRLAASWRTWIVPAAVAFVAGIAVAAASFLGYAGLMTTDQTSILTTGTDTSERFQEGSTVVEVPEPVPGNVEAAREVLARPQEPEDVLGETALDIVPDSPRLIYASQTERVYAATSVDYPFCLLLTDLTMQQTSMTCASEENFAANSVQMGMSQSITEKLSVLWNGVALTMTRTTD